MPCFQAFSGGRICIYIRAALMVVPDVVLRDLALIVLFLLGQEVHGVGLLEQGVALVLLVPQNRGFDTISV